MASIAVPSFLSWLGIAKESVSGTPVTATSFIPLTTMTPADNVTYLEDKGMRGAPVNTYGLVAGPRSSTYDLAGDVFADSIGFPLAGLLGDVVVTGAAPNVVSVMSALNSGTGQPPSYTLTDYDGAKARQYAGSQFTDLSISFTAEGLLQHTSKVTGLASVLQGSPPTPSFTAVQPNAVWQGVAQIAGAANATIVDGSVDFQRTATIITSIANTQSPQQIFVGPLSVSGKLTVVTDSAETEYARYLNGTTAALDLVWSSGTGNSIRLHMTQNQYTAATIDRSKDYTQTSITFESIANTTDKGASNGFSPVKATLINAVATGTYA